MITNLALNEFINSPLFAALVTVGAMGLGALAVASVRLLVKLGQIETKVDALAQHIEDVMQDKDVVRWSTISGAQIHIPRTPGT